MNSKNTKKELFSYQSFFSFLVGVQNILFLTPWPKNRAPQKHYKNRGFSKGSFGKKTVMRHGTAIFGQKNQIQKFQLSFVFAFFFSFNNKKHNNLLKPLFLQCFSRPKKENFQKMNLKQRNSKNPIFAPFFRKRLFLGNWQKTGHKKKHKMITEHQKIC